jgi:hypothetical protein
MNQGRAAIQRSRWPKSLLEYYERPRDTRAAHSESLLSR